MIECQTEAITIRFINADSISEHDSLIIFYRDHNKYCALNKSHIFRNKTYKLLNVLSCKNIFYKSIGKEIPFVYGNDHPYHKKI